MSPGKQARPRARPTAATAPRWGRGEAKWGAGWTGPEAGDSARGRRGDPRGEWEPSGMAGRGRLALEGGRRAYRPRGTVPLVVLAQLPVPSSPGPWAPQTAPWVTVTTSTIEGAGTSSEESAATTTDPEKETKDGEETTGMIGDFVPRLPGLICPAPPSLLFPCSFAKMNRSETRHWTVFCGLAYLLLPKNSPWLNF